MPSAPTGPGDPAVSVVIPAYNAEGWLRRSVESVLTQDFADLELIIVDDGSKDGTAALVQVFAAADPRVRIVTQANGGLGFARNSGLAVARGHTVMFLDADDLFAPGIVGAAHRALRDHDARIAIFNGASFAEPGVGASIVLNPRPYFPLGPAEADRVRTGLWFLKRTQGAINQACMKAYDREFLQEHTIRFPEVRAGEDTWFLYCSFSLAERVVYIDLVGYQRSYHPGSIMTSHTIENPLRRIEFFPTLVTLIDQQTTSEHRRVLTAQLANYGWLLWVMCQQRHADSRRILLANFTHAGIDTWLRDHQVTAAHRAFVVAASPWGLPVRRVFVAAVSAILRRRVHGLV